MKKGVIFGLSVLAVAIISVALLLSGVFSKSAAQSGLNTESSAGDDSQTEETQSPTPTPAPTPEPILLASEPLQVTSDTFAVDAVKLTLAVTNTQIGMDLFLKNVKSLENTTCKVVTEDSRTAAEGFVQPGMKLLVTESVNNTSTIYTIVKAELEKSEIKEFAFYSDSLKKEMKMHVYLPKGYNSETKYPVLYAVHGYAGDDSTMIPNYELNLRADELIENGKINPVIIAAPDMENSFGINSSDATSEDAQLNYGMYEDYLCKDVISFIDSNYSTIANRDGRYIAGVSMGGYIAIYNAFVHTDIFGKVAGCAPALFIGSSGNGLSDWLYPDEATQKQRDPIMIAQEKDLTSLKVYLCCGDKDDYGFYNGCDALYKILQEKGVESQYVLAHAKHEVPYFISAVEGYMIFLAGK